MRHILLTKVPLQTHSDLSKRAILKELNFNIPFLRMIQSYIRHKDYPSSFSSIGKSKRNAFFLISRQQIIFSKFSIFFGKNKIFFFKLLNIFQFFCIFFIFFLQFPLFGIFHGFAGFFSDVFGFLGII